METVEVVVYLGVAVLLGGMILAFVWGWDATATYASVKRIFTGDESSGFERATGAEFPHLLLSAWEACGMGAAEYNATVYISDDVTIDKAALFTAYKRASLCKTIQSASEGCGTREDVEMTMIDGPAVVRLRCDPALQRIVVS